MKWFWAQRYKQIIKQLGHSSKLLKYASARQQEQWNTRVKRKLKIMSKHTHLQMNETFICSSQSKAVQKLSDYDFYLVIGQLSA